MTDVATARYPSLSRLPVLITGGGSGIGASIVEHFAAQGSRVGFLEIDAATARRCAEATAAATGVRPAYRICDLKDVEATRKAVADLSTEIGPVRALINNAGNDDRHPTAEITPDYWDDRFAVNLRQQFFVAQAIVGPMGEAGGGSIVNLGSISWMMGAVGLVAYTTAKSAVAGLTKSLAREFGVKSIRVNCIAPGWILTDKQITRAKATNPGNFENYLTRQCLKEHLAPPDVARLALWLAADDSRLVTAQTFIVDGGVI